MTTISMYYQNLETVQSSKLVKYVLQGNRNPYTSWQFKSLHFLRTNSTYVTKCKAFTLPSNTYMPNGFSSTLLPPCYFHKSMHMRERASSLIFLE
jgi:hypothetical protein